MKTNLLMAALVVGLMAIWPVGSSFQPTATAQIGAPDVVVNEVAWAGTVANSADEWIEIRNNSTSEIDLAGYVLRWDDGETVIRFDPEATSDSNAVEVRRTTIPADGFLLLERTDDNAIGDVEADVIYTGALGNGGEALQLLDEEGDVVDEVNANGGEWPAGAASDGEVPYASMERIDPEDEGTDANWATNDGVIRNGTDAGGNLINGTPKAENSQKDTN